MKNPFDTGLPAALLALSLLGATGCKSAFADEKKKDYPKPGASAEPSAAPPVAAPPKPSGGPSPWVPTLDVELPEGASPAPSREEWAHAAFARDVRITQPSCEAKRIREWYRLSCGSARIELVSGSRAGVSFGCRRESPDSELCEEASVVFPARRGDRRAFDFLQWSRWGPEPDAIATEQMIDGDAAPSISIQGIRWSF